MQLRSLLVGPRLTHHSHPVHGLLAHAHRLAALNRLLGVHLGEPLAEHCRVADLAGDTLVLHADSSVWSSKLRFRGPDILAFLHQHADEPYIQRVRIRVRRLSPAVPAARSEPRPAKLSDAAGKAIREAALGVEGEQLREALLRLAGRAGQG